MDVCINTYIHTPATHISYECEYVHANILCIYRSAYLSIYIHSRAQTGFYTFTQYIDPHRAGGHKGDFATARPWQRALPRGSSVAR